ncbi:MAG: S-layer homology domain-containing protein [Clostridia bacterium]|nr:S-layer homology domain-containing protein [Clostridia bacterium]
MKKIISLLLMLSLLFSISIGAFAYNAYPSGDGKIIVSGEKNPDRPIGLLVYPKDSTQIVSIGQAPAGEGEFLLTLPIGGADGLDYTVKIDGETLINVNNISSADALAELNAASDGVIKNVIDKYNFVFGFDLLVLDAIYNKQTAYEALAAKTFTSAQNAASEYLDALSDVINNEKLEALSLISQGNAMDAVSKYIGHFAVDKAAFDAVKTKAYVYNFLNGNTYNQSEFETAFADAILVANINDASGDAFISLVRESQAKIGLDLGEDANIAAIVFTKADARPAKDFAELKTIFMEEISLNKLNTATKDTVKSVLEAENSVLGILNVSGYSSLGEEEKKAVCQSMAGGNFASVEAARQEFSAIVERVNNPQIPSAPPSPSKPSSGGNVSISGGSSAGGTTVPSAGTANLPFTDITTSHWGYSAIADLYSQKIISGTSETTFEPEREVTREEFVKMLVGTFGLFNVSAKNVFTDVPDDHWSLKFVASAYEKGLTLGKDDGSFGIGELLTRQDMATLAARCADIARLNLSNNNNLVFADEDKVSEYAKESVYKLSAAGIINGVGNNMFSPNQSCTRAMAAKVCNELLKLYQGGVIR